MTNVPTLITGAGPDDSPVGGLRPMRRPAPHHPHTGLTGWSHPYAPSPSTFYADGGDEPTNDDAAAPQVPKPTPPASKIFTQDEVAALAAKEKSQGERAGARRGREEFATEHGFKSAEEAAEFIALARKAREDAMSEEEKRRTELERREAELTARETAAIQRERNANRRAVLVGLGAAGDDLDDAAALLRVDDDADDAVIQEAATKLKERRPELFGARSAAAPSSLPPAPGGAPAGGPPARPASTGKPGDRGREMARIRGHLKNTA